MVSGKKNEVDIEWSYKVHKNRFCIDIILFNIITFLLGQFLFILGIYIRNIVRTAYYNVNNCLWDASSVHASCIQACKYLTHKTVNEWNERIRFWTQCV